MTVLVGKYALMANHEAECTGLSGKAFSILDALADLMRRRDLGEIVEIMELCGILGREEAQHFLRSRAQKATKEATGLLQALRIHSPYLVPTQKLSALVQLALYIWIVPII